jgi:AcrR family transcriptional regulator
MPLPESAPALRERKKAKTRAAIQRHALRLFAEQGYAETTIEAIAEAAEVSPSTFFRYFGTKEAVVAFDPIDPVVFELFQTQPAELSPIQALRATLHAMREELSTEDLQREQQRGALAWSVPELRAAALDQFTANVGVLAEQVAERAGLDPDGFRARAFAGAITGVTMAAMTTIRDDPSKDLFELVDEGLGYLEAGLPT